MKPLTAAATGMTNIKFGSTLSNDPLPDKRFDFQFVNPPCGYERSKDFDAVTTEAARGFDGRFGAGLPRKSDGQMLFLQHFIAWMNDAEDAQSYIGIIMNGSPLFTGSDTALRGSAFLQSEPSPQVVSEAKDNFRKDEDMRWQPSGARQIAKGNPQGERGGVHQCGVPPKGNANFAWVQHFIHHLAPQGMVGFVLADGSISSNQSGDRQSNRHNS